LKNSFVQRLLEFHAAHVPCYPTHRTFYRFEAIKLYPDALPDSGSFDKLDLATLGRGVEDPDAVAADPRSADARLGGKFKPGRRTRSLRTRFPRHASRLISNRPRTDLGESIMDRNFQLSSNPLSAIAEIAAVVIT